MDFSKRFLFHAHAAAIGGRIVRRNDRPVDILIHSRCETSLVPVGGRSTAKSGAGKYGGGLVRFRSAATSAEGLFEDHAQVVRASRGLVPEDSLVATTTVSAEIHDIVVGDEPQLRVKRLSVMLESRSPRGSGQPSIRPIQVDGRRSGKITARTAGKAGNRGPNRTEIKGVTIDGHELIVDLNLPIYDQYDTHAKLLGAVDDPAFVEQHGQCLFLRSGVDRRDAPPHGRLVTSYHGIHGTIVKKLRWKGPGYPGAEIDHNSVKVPEFGTIYFGELLIADRSRRLTMMRVKLGSPTGGDVAFASAEPNGSWS